MSPAECSFCQIIDRDDPDAREVYRDENVVAFFPTDPAVLGHTLVVPRRHVPDIWSLRTEEASQLSAAVLRLAEAVRSAVLPEGFNIIQSNGAAATQTVPHLHIHLVPRNAGDAIGPIWPPLTNYPDELKDRALNRVKSAMATLPPIEPEVSPEDRRKHLDYIQAVVTRQSAASSSAKGWLLPVITAVFGFALTQHVWLLAVLGMFLIAVFAYVDANYLRSEKAYRALYRTVSRSERLVPQFTLGPADAHEPPPDDAPITTKWKALREKYLPERAVWTSWAIAPFYGALLLLGVGVAITAGATAVKSAPPGPVVSTTVVAPTSTPATSAPASTTPSAQSVLPPNWSMLLQQTLLAGGTYAMRVTGPLLRARLAITPRVEAVMERATIVLLIAVALTSTLFIGSEIAGPARPIGVAVGIVAAVFRAPLIVVIVLAAASTAGLRALGMA